MATVTHQTALPDTAQKTDFYNVVDSAKVTGIVGADIASSADIEDIKLQTIRTAGKLGGSAMVELGNIPAGAGLIPAVNVATLNQSTTGTASNVTGTVAIANGGTGQVTAQAAIDAMLPSQTGNNGKFLTTNASASSWGTVSSAGYSNVLFQWYGSFPFTSGSADHFSTSGILSTRNPGSLNYYTAFNTSSQSTYYDFFATKFMKTAGINTVTAYFYAKCDGQSAYIRTTIGSVSGELSNVAISVGWVSLTVDVSSLTNGTVYDVTIASHNSGQNNGGLTSVFNLIAFGS